MTNTEALMTWARERFLRTKQQLKRTMISSADWPPPNLLYSSSVTCHIRPSNCQRGTNKGLPQADTSLPLTAGKPSSVRARCHSSRIFLSDPKSGQYVDANEVEVRRIREDSGLHQPYQQQAKTKKDNALGEEKNDDDGEEEGSYHWLDYCCCRDNSERHQSHRLSSMLSGTYKAQHGHMRNRHTSTQLTLKTGPDGSLICDNNVDINMLIAGFREFEKHFQYGALMPFFNVLPTSLNPIVEDSRLQEASDDKEVSEISAQEPVQMKSLCPTKRISSRDKKVSFADLQRTDGDYS
ncbi:unnamed protein product [Schistocephalus solidus]|uniref:Uncharacterized protein n=1 Tax=Schistocephalus solidus TaxID=70667 RepID=A0A183TCV4_SCHSO|nr:unnamed protein product [Schistocephalus solidus]